MIQTDTIEKAAGSAIRQTSDGNAIAVQSASASKPSLQRTTFKTSRLLDFASEKELVAQTGHQPDAWPLVCLKELVDNSIDACEDTDTPPEVTIVVNEGGISVSDNGPGLPASTVKDVLNFQVRSSSREAYAAPTRGAQGNALKTIVAMPFVLDGALGRIEIEAMGIHHVIDFTVDRIRQEPVITHNQTTVESKKGTLIKVEWPDQPRSNLRNAKARFLQIASDYSWLNPHLTIRLGWFGEAIQIAATAPAWSKWKPSDPTSAWWYTPDKLERLIAAYISNEATSARTIREFVSEFRGLSGTAKQKVVLENMGLAREPLSALVKNSSIDTRLVRQLLAAMQKYSTQVNPILLGSIGREHFSANFEASGCEMDSFEYRRAMDTTDSVPWIVEVAFGWCPNAEGRQLVTGVNWSPSIVNPFRELGSYGVSLDTILSQQRVERDDPVILILHLTCPTVTFTDRGKSAVVIHSGQSEAIIEAVQGVTKKWCKQRKQEERSTSAAINRMYAMTKNSHVSQRDAAWMIMEKAYMQASANGTLPAHARQIMYAARPHILRTAGDLGKGFDKYFSQTLLPDYIEEKGVVWNVVYDARGHFTEPHTKEQVPLGTLQVRNYLRRIASHRVGELDFDIAEEHYPTLGPKHRFKAILFIEKEGFMPLFEAVKLAERYDIAIMSTKGMSVIASRELLDSLCADQEVQLLVLHDFDKSGFSIVGTLCRDSKRFQFSNKISVVDLGIRLKDIAGLETESVSLDENSAVNLRANGATEAEIKFLQRSRVELNAFTSDKFITWIEAKFKKHGVKKVVPDEVTLEIAYRRRRQQAAVQAVIDAALEDMQDDDSDVPGSLAEQISELQDADRTLTWDEALKRIVMGDAEEAA